MDEKKITINDYFISEEHKIIFAALYTDTVLRETLLGISEELYSNPQKAKEWRNAIIKKIHPDHCMIGGADKAVIKIYELYAHMTEENDEDGENNE